MMKILSAGLLFNLFFAAISGRSLRELDERQRYIIMHPINEDPLGEFTEITVGDISNFNIGDIGYTIASLTSEEALILKNQLDINSSIELDSEIDMPNDIMQTDPNVITTGDMGDAATTPYLNNVPRCGATVNNVDIFVLDTVLYKDLAEFSEVNITLLPGNVDPLPCKSHGTEVTSIIVGKNYGVITKGDRHIYGIGVFDCLGKGYVSSLLQAFNQVKTHDVLARRIGRRTIVNFSGTAPKTTLLDAATKALYTAGIPVFVAAGNNALNACDRYSPAAADGIYTLGATQSPGDIPASFTNFGSPCVEAYLPGNAVTVLSVYTNRSRLASGTSFSSPIGAAQGAIEFSMDLKASPDYIYQRITDRTVSVTPNGGYPMRVMLANVACPIQRKLFDSFKTTNIDNNKFNNWQLGVRNSNNRFCVKFSAKFSNRNGWALIGMRSNSTDTPYLSIKIGDQIRNRIFEHKAQKGLTTLARKSTVGRILSTTSPKAIQIEQVNRTITVSYANGANKQKLLSMADEKDYADIAFSVGGGGQVQYTNALTCM